MPFISYFFSGVVAPTVQELRFTFALVFVEMNATIEITFVAW